MQVQQCPAGIAASHSSITGPHPAITFPLLPRTKPVTPVCFCRCRTCSSGEAEKWTVAMSRCLCSWQSSSRPPLSLPQEMSFSNSVSNVLNFSLLSSYKIKRKRDQLLAMASTCRAFALFFRLFFFHTSTHIAKTTSALVKCNFENETTKQNLQGDAPVWSRRAHMR